MMTSSRMMMMSYSALSLRPKRKRNYVPKNLSRKNVRLPKEKTRKKSKETKIGE